MIIVYNPPKGAVVQNFIFKGVMIEPHLVGQLMQYEDDMGQELLETFEFLQKLTPEEAKKIMDAPKEPKFKCEFCDFATDQNIALMGHMRKHKDEIEKKKAPIVDPNLIPVAKGSKVEGRIPLNDPERAVAMGKDIPDGIDKDGVSWYGGGLKEDNSMRRVNPPGKAHFMPTLD